VPLTRWLRIGWLVLLADVLYWISPVAGRDGDLPMADWHARFNTVTFFGGWILFALLLLGSYIAWVAKQREL
jgi:hypothetical protein